METVNVRWEVQVMKDCQFTVVIERQPDGEYLVSVPALPGCYTEGSTREEAREMAADAICAYCASLLKHGEPIPCESSEEQYVGRLSARFHRYAPGLTLNDS
jgi:antitoxin HicB